MLIFMQDFTAQENDQLVDQLKRYFWSDGYDTFTLIQTVTTYSEKFNQQSEQSCKGQTSHKNPENPDCNYVIITNKPRNFQNLSVIGTSLSDFHKMTVTVLRMQFRILKPRVLLYKNYNIFLNETFINCLKVELDTQCISPYENDFLNFSKFCAKTLNKHVSRKRKTIREIKVRFSIKKFQKLLWKELTPQQIFETWNR